MNKRKVFCEPCTHYEYGKCAKPTKEFKDTPKERIYKHPDMNIDNANNNCKHYSNYYAPVLWLLISLLASLFITIGILEFNR